MTPESQSSVTPLASTASGLRRTYGNGLNLAALVALSLDRNGSGLPAFAAQIDADAQPKDDDSLTVQVPVPSNAYGIDYAAGATKDGELVVIGRIDRALLSASADKRWDVAAIVRDMFQADGTIKGAPADYRTALLPASPASDDQVLVTLAGDEVTEIELPFDTAREIGISRISDRKNGKHSIPAAYLTARIDDQAIYADDESNVVTSKPTWVEIARFDAAIAAIARENGDGIVIVQLADGSFIAIGRSHNCYTTKLVEQTDTVRELIAAGYRYLGVTSAWGNGSSHGLFAKKPAAKGERTAVQFVPAALLPEAFLGEADRAKMIAQA